MTNFQILYSLPGVKKARKISDNYSAAHLYLDRFGTVQKYMQYARNLLTSDGDLINPLKDIMRGYKCLAHLETMKLAHKPVCHFVE